MVRGPRAAARSSATAPANQLRPRDAARDRHVRRHRELLAAPHAPPAGRGAVHADGLPARRHADLCRRVARGRAADRRHARRRPLAQGGARRVRVPPAQCVRQPAAELRGMGGAGEPRDLRTGAVDVVVGINLLREGLDLPEVAFIGILDADKEGYLRAYRSFIQTIGRAARNVEGHVVMYADKITDSMRAALDETERRRDRQTVYNAERGITPESVKKAIYALEINKKDLQADAVELMIGAGVPREDILAIVRDLEKEMRRLSKELQFEDAARVRDRIILLRKRLAGEETGDKEDDEEVSLAIAAAPKQRTTVRNWRKTRRGP